MIEQKAGAFTRLMYYSKSPARCKAKIARGRLLLLTYGAKNATVLRVIIMELWDIYNAERERTGDTMVRGEIHGEGQYHLVVHAAVFSTDGRLLIQRRCALKQTFANKWDMTVGGSAITGENSREAVRRELREELGLDIDFSGIRPRMTVNFEHGFDDYFVVVRDVDISSLRLQAEEVSDAKWASRKEVMAMIDSGEFIPFIKSFINLLFDMTKSPDNLTEAE